MTKPVNKLEAYDTTLVVSAQSGGTHYVLGIVRNSSTAEELIRDHKSRFELFAAIPDGDYQITSAPMYQVATPLRNFNLGAK